jgi:hypothetical protein
MRQLASSLARPSLVWWRTAAHFQMRGPDTIFIATICTQRILRPLNRRAGQHFFAAWFNLYREPGALHALRAPLTAFLPPPRAHNLILPGRGPSDPCRRISHIVLPPPNIRRGGVKFSFCVWARCPSALN